MLRKKDCSNKKIKNKKQKIKNYEKSPIEKEKEKEKERDNGNEILKKTDVGITILKNDNYNNNTKNINNEIEIEGHKKNEKIIENYFMKTEIGNFLDKNLKEKNEIEKKEKNHVFLTSPKQEKIKEKKDEIFNNEILQLEQRLSLDEMKNIAEELSLSSNRKANIVNKKFNLDDWSVQKNNSNEGRTYDSPPN